MTMTLRRARRSAARVGAVLMAVALTLSSLPLPAQTPGKSAAAPQPRFRGAPVTLNFVNADIEGVARAMAAILRQQFIVDPRVRGTITLYSEDPLTPNEAYLNFLAALRGLGFTVVEVGGIFKVVPEAILTGLALRTISELLRVSTRIDGAAVPRFCAPGAAATGPPPSVRRCSSGWMSAATA